MNETNDLQKQFDNMAEVAKLVIPSKTTQDIDQTLSRDPISETRKFLKDSEYCLDQRDQDILMLGHAMNVNAQKDKLLRAEDDTLFSDSLARYHRILGEIGFEKVLELDFVDCKWEKKSEKFFIFFRRKGGILLAHDTYGGDKVNGGHFYYNWKPNEEYYNQTRNPNYRGSLAVTSSGTFRIKDESGKIPWGELYPNHGVAKTTDPEVLERERIWNEKWDREAVWVGDHDCREAVRHKIAKLEKYGTLLDKWEFSPHLWLLHYNDTAFDGWDSKAITKERVAMLPDYVQEAIKGG